MKAGKYAQWWWTAQTGLLLCLATGCVTNRGSTRPALEGNQAAPSLGSPHDDRYRLGCPDVLEVTVADQPSVRPRVSADGRMDLGPLGVFRVEGLTCPEVRSLIADAARVSPDQVEVRVKEYRSQQVFILGEINGIQRAVPYRGRETVRELLHRAGGLTAGAEPNDVYVIRAHIADGARPEVFPIPLRDTEETQERKADLKLEPFDQVYIGETHRASVCRCLPPCLRPLYESIWGMKRPPKPVQEGAPLPK